MLTGSGSRTAAVQYAVRKVFRELVKQNEGDVRAQMEERLQRLCKGTSSRRKNR